MKLLNLNFLKDIVRELFSNKGNLFFMVLALVISLTALNTIYSLGESAKRQVLEALANLQFGKDALLIIAGGGRIIGLTTTRTDTLKLEDVEEIKRLSFVKLASSWSRGILEVSYQGEAEKLRVDGVDLNYSLANNWYTSSGRFFNQQDMESLAKVCVVGADLPKKFKIKNPIGEKIKIRGEYFEIIGVLEPKTFFGHFRADERVLIPFTTAQRRVFNKDYIDAVKLLFYPDTDMKMATQTIRQILRKRHNLYGVQPDDFRLITPEMSIQRFTEASRTINIFLLAISLISLIISGVIIMNLMYANIEEKAPIIALRIALGATSKILIKHYLTMCLLIALLSGVIGWFLSIILMQAISLFTPLKPLFSWVTFLLSLAFATITCVVFGLIPALKATQIEPSILLKSL